MYYDDILFQFHYLRYLLFLQSHRLSTIEFVPCIGSSSCYSSRLLNNITKYIRIYQRKPATCAAVLTPCTRGYATEAKGFQACPRVRNPAAAKIAQMAFAICAKITGGALRRPVRSNNDDKTHIIRQNRRHVRRF